MKPLVKNLLIVLVVGAIILVGTYWLIMRPEYDYQVLLDKYNQRGDSLRQGREDIKMEKWRSARRRDSAQMVINYYLFKVDSTRMMDSVVLRRVLKDVDKYKKMNDKQLQHEADSIYNAALRSRPGN